MISLGTLILPFVVSGSFIISYILFLAYGTHKRRRDENELQRRMADKALYDSEYASYTNYMTRYITELCEQDRCYKARRRTED